ncbi:cytochrome d ubiquinol oxidase subunit II [Amycolatopsis sp. cg5]|uniref:cytochrome d ubiquinol oxidase subunit II n=1 Tax=Amycolatopsis sp. cg5 TaxID=3238802 RepID=UPI0035253724
MSLETLWFCVIALFWLGYLFLEGFDFGVGMLLPHLGKDNTERRLMINTIGPVWDGNEVWLIVAVAATFAAFPGWYASLLSGSYLVVLLIVLALIGRGVAFEYRGKVDSANWRAAFDKLIVFGSWVPPLGVGLLLATTVLGLPLDVNGNRVGSPFEAIRWDTLLGALAIVGFSLVHGATFLALKTSGEFRERAKKTALRLFPALIPLIAFLVLIQAREGEAWTLIPLVVAVVAAPTAWWRLRKDRDGQAFAALGVLIVATAVTMFGALFPAVLPSTGDPANSLTIANAASSPYTLEVMTWVSAFGAPAVLIYQGWTYWVFRKRLSTAHIPS